MENLINYDRKKSIEKSKVFEIIGENIEKLYYIIKNKNINFKLMCVQYVDLRPKNSKNKEQMDALISECTERMQFFEDIMKEVYRQKKELYLSEDDQKLYDLRSSWQVITAEITTSLSGIEMQKYYRKEFVQKGKEAPQFFKQHAKDLYDISEIIFMMSCIVEKAQKKGILKEPSMIRYPNYGIVAASMFLPLQQQARDYIIDTDREQHLENNLNSGNYIEQLNKAVKDLNEMMEEGYKENQDKKDQSAYFKEHHNKLVNFSENLNNSSLVLKELYAKEESINFISEHLNFIKNLIGLYDSLYCCLFNLLPCRIVPYDESEYAKQTDYKRICKYKKILFEYISQLNLVKSYYDILPIMDVNKYEINHALNELENLKFKLMGHAYSWGDLTGTQKELAEKINAI